MYGITPLFHLRIEIIPRISQQKLDLYINQKIRSKKLLHLAIINLAVYWRRLIDSCVQRLNGGHQTELMTMERVGGLGREERETTP